ncbi:MULTISPECIES: NUDIX hydrolase [unclassified Streptomyces]|uniref:NUDIX hydrolase n=1 Tax=Streptomyces evansiae TaxID=3075535 RepID=A0ABD5EEQ5_9ACTN|nr:MULTISPECIES: NUDIX hydrolase [unclassified Streptomyces]ASY33633.1 DNA mismatch repair protein MutT [Streptomyces sp. CLI2509]MDT0419143.1 NUDIX hydrolase [Streptomyces sp. DSM 41982]MDT0423626.1 NUDIX hydrolase [Streptomyces sp. DSM 41859]NJA59699.1 NUDIX hydrolase [Streptomyces sp. NEAU-H3]WEH28868.1 NUDIX hydrolase [Streptomyces sp. AM 3-1-1]
MSTPVRAAGCVLWRRSPAHGVEFCLVSRPKWHDWSLPKGKLKHGETELAAALREVEEETGRTCRPTTRLPRVHYRTHDGRRKTVDYWLAEETGGTFTPNQEIDEIRWLPTAAAAELLTEARDRALLAQAVRELALSRG